MTAKTPLSQDAGQDADRTRLVWNQFWQTVADDPDQPRPDTLAVLDTIRAVIECARLVRSASPAERAGHEAALAAALSTQTDALHHWHHARP